MNHPLRIGIIGCGNVAVNRHLPMLRSLKEAEVVALSDIDSKQLHLAADIFGIEKRFDNYEKLLQEPDIKAVGVLVPLPFHYEIASAVLDAGKHLFLEKPITMTSVVKYKAFPILLLVLCMVK